MNKIFRFGYRPVLLLGADRELTIIISVFCAIILMYSFSIILAIFVISFWLITVKFLRMMGKADPLMRHVYRNHVKYKAVYLAKSSVFCKSKKIYR